MFVCLFMLRHSPSIEAGIIQRLSTYQFWAYEKSSVFRVRPPQHSSVSVVLDHRGYWLVWHSSHSLHWYGTTDQRIHTTPVALLSEYLRCGLKTLPYHSEYRGYWRSTNQDSWNNKKQIRKKLHESNQNLVAMVFLEKYLISEDTLISGHLLHLDSMV